MALVITTIEENLTDAFKDMTDGDNKVFSKEVSMAVKKYAESGDITTVDAGTISTGVYTGAGTGGITVDETICEKIVYAACTAMDNMKEGGNAYLAEKMAGGIHAMLLAGEVKTDVKGTVTPPSSSPVTLDGNAAGTLTGVPAPMQASFFAAFNSMDGMKSGGDEYMAEQVYTAIDTYLKTAIVSTKGSDVLSGSVGTGKMA